MSGASENGTLRDLDFRRNESSAQRLVVDLADDAADQSADD
jgi:hypothetical protein